MLRESSFSNHNLVEQPFSNGDDSMTLPVLATAGDVREAVQFLKRYQDGITIVQAMDAFRKRVFDPRKIAAYEFWGVVLRAGDRIKLSPLGWELARRLAPEAQVYRTILTRIAAYHSALEWIHDQKLELVTYLEIGAFWQEQHTEMIAEGSEEELEARAASFFHICHAAEVGLLTVGRKGQPTRLHIYHADLRGYLENGVLSRVESSPDDLSESLAKPDLVTASAPKQRVFISHSASDQSLQRLFDVLRLAEIDYELMKRKPGHTSESYGPMLAAMRRCNSGIIAIGDADWSDGESNSALLIEIGSALMQFNERLLFLLPDGVALPLDLSITSFSFNGEVNWNVAIQLVQSLKQLTSASASLDQNVLT